MNLHIISMAVTSQNIVHKESSDRKGYYTIVCHLETTENFR